MNSRRGKRFALWITGVGLLVLFACAVAFKDRAVEEYWLWKLESDDIEEQKAAAENLAEVGSVRAVPVMLQKLCGRSFLFLPYEDMDGDGDRDLYVPPGGSRRQNSAWSSSKRRKADSLVCDGDTTMLSRDRGSSALRMSCLMR